MFYCVHAVIHRVLEDLMFQQLILKIQVGMLHMNKDNRLGIYTISYMHITSKCSKLQQPVITKLFLHNINTLYKNQ